MPIEANSRRRSITPFHQSYEPPVFCVIAKIAEAVDRIVDRIRRDENTYGSAGTYLYIRPDRTVYLVREELTCSQRWVKEHFAWLVGFYTRLPNPNRGLSLEAQGMFEDITEHLKHTSGATQGREYLGVQQTGDANSLQPATSGTPLERSQGRGDIITDGGGRSSRKVKP